MQQSHAHRAETQTMFKVLERSADDLGKIVPVAIGRQGAGFDPREIQQIADNTVQMIDLQVDRPG
jgi:hypothetical protein